MDEVSKYRIIGATIWLGLLVLIVPTWYSNPVNFQPTGHLVTTVEATRPIVDHAYTITAKDHNIEEPQRNAALPTESVAKPTSPEVEVVAETVDSSILTAGHAPSSKVKPPAKTQWIVRIAAFPAQSEAKKLESRLKANYAVSVKHFEKSKVYSVRAGPYDSKAKAQAEQVKLDKLLGTQSQVVAVP